MKFILYIYIEILISKEYEIQGNTLKSVTYYVVRLVKANSYITSIMQAEIKNR